MAPRKNSRAGSASKTSAAAAAPATTTTTTTTITTTNGVVKRAPRATKQKGAAPLRRSSRLNSAGPSDSVAGTSVAGSEAATSHPSSAPSHASPPSAPSVASEEEEEEEKPKTAYEMALEEEIARLRKENAELKLLVARQPQEESPVAVPAPVRGPSRDLRFAMTFGPAIRARELAQAEETRRQALASPRARSSSPTPSSPIPAAAPAVSTTSSPVASPAATTEAMKTPPPPAPIAASPWGIGSLIGSAMKLLRNQPASPVGVTETPSAITPSRRPRAERETTTRAPPQTPTPQTSAPKTPAPAMTEEPDKSPSPVQSVRTERRRGQMKGFIYTPRGSASTPRRKPVEPNADKRATIIEQAAETKRIQAEQAADRKRIQEQASVLEEEKRNAENEQDQLDTQTVAQQKAGDKRKRVKIDDLKEIPARLPGESSGTFSFRDEFFTYDSDSEDEVELDETEADNLSYFDEQERPAKKMKIGQNVFQATTPKKQAPAAPSTPAPHTQQSQDFSIEQQKLRASQYKPKKPSGLGQAAPLTPRQISAMTPASQYYTYTNGQNNLSAISERTEPAQTPAVSFPPPKFPIAASPAASAVPTTSVDTNTAAAKETSFSFPQAQPLYIAHPDLYTKEGVEAELATLPSKMTETESDAAGAKFAAGFQASKYSQAPIRQAYVEDAHSSPIGSGNAFSSSPLIASAA